MFTSMSTTSVSRIEALQDFVQARALRLAMGLPTRLQRLLNLRPVRRDGLELDPETQLMLALQRLSRSPKVEALPLAEARRELVRQTGLVGGRQPIGGIRDLVVDGADGPIPARLYLPTSSLGRRPLPTLMYFHGGGFLYGDLASHDAACRFLAETSGVQVLAVDYRLAPEHPYPAPVQDGVAAYRWLVAHAADVNADPERLAVGGDSAGAALATVVAVHAAAEGLPLAFQLLVYPVTDFVNESRSRELFAEGFYLTKGFMDNAEAAYLADPAQAKEPDASPLLRTDWPAGVAPAHVVTAGFDPLRDEGEAYAALLAEQGIEVTSVRYPGMIHGFFNVVGAGRSAKNRHVEIAERLASALA